MNDGNFGGHVIGETELGRNEFGDENIGGYTSLNQSILGGASFNGTISGGLHYGKGLHGASVEATNNLATGETVVEVQVAGFGITSKTEFSFTKDGEWKVSGFSIGVGGMLGTQASSVFGSFGSAISVSLGYSVDEDGAFLGLESESSFGFGLGTVAGGLHYGIDDPGADPELASVTTTEYDPKTGLTTERTFIPIGFVWIDGVKVDVLHVTEVVTDPTGKVVERTTYSLEVTDAAEALGLLRDYAESQMGAPGTEGAEDRMWGGSDIGTGTTTGGLLGSAGPSQQVSGGGSSGPNGARPSSMPVNSPNQNSGGSGEGPSQQTPGGGVSGPTNASSGGTTSNQAGNNYNGNTATDSAGRTRSDPKFTGPQPILLDLDGDGVKITEFGNSTQFMTGKDGLQHRSSWAGAGDGVLFYDPDGRNAITETRQYVFTEWNPTAAGDMEALRSVWDTNGDGKLTSADAEFAKFKVMVTNADGSTSVMTLAALGITEIDLTVNATRIELPDGSITPWQTTFTRSNGTTEIRLAA